VSSLATAAMVDEHGVLAHSGKVRAVEVKRLKVLASTAHSDSETKERRSGEASSCSGHGELRV
jgi:hypothetical protein